MISQEEFLKRSREWEQASDKEREEMLPFLTPAERSELNYYEAEGINRCSMLLAFDFDKAKYEAVIAKFGDKHRHWRDVGLKAIQERQKQLEIERKEAEKKARNEAYKNRPLATDYEIVPLASTTPIKDVKQPKSKPEPKPKKERVSGESGMAFEGFGEAAPVTPLVGSIHTEPSNIQRREPRAVPQRREPKRESE